ncbi:MAG: ParB/RepB/Spo0J family partition protein [Eubacteriales bacterium]|nr:ParB/RepB/Spo0J family partition protein [Eubacteriales bacterium]
MARKRMGRGLGEIFGDEQVAAAAEKIKSKRTGAAEAARTKDAAEAENVSRETSKIKISLIEPNSDQPRKNFDEKSLNELAESIKEHGVIQPILVRQNGQMFKIIVGERRWRAARLAGLKEIPAIVKDFDDRETAEVALIENIQREDLSSVEEAKAFRSLIEDYGLTQEELATRVSKNRTTITNSLRLLQLDDSILDLLDSGEISAGHARAILAVNGKKAQYKAAREIINDKLSVREAEKLAKRYNKKTEKKTPEPDKDALYYEAVANELTESIKLRVNIRKRSKNGGRVEIEYNSYDELETIIERIKAAE